MGSGKFTERSSADDVGDSVSLLFDTYSSNIYSGYSVRKLSSSYTGNCLRIREDGGNTEVDIGFNGNGIDQAAIVSHCGANNGYVVTWYDQGGNSKNITNAVAADQPQIYNGSSVILDSKGNVALNFDGTNQLTFRDINAGLIDSSEFWVGEIANNVRLDNLWGGGDLGGGQNYFVYLDNNGVDAINLRYSLSTGNKPYVASSIANDVPFIVSVRRNYSGATANLRINQDGGYNAVTATGATNHEGLVLCGRYNAVTNRLEGKVSEFLRWHSEFSDDDADAVRVNLNAEYTLY